MKNIIQKAGLYIGTSGLLLSGCLAGNQAGSSTMSSKPNVLFIMTDQHNIRALGAYGNSEISTPNIDALARAGMLFTNAVCNTPQCVPSRYSIWTGRYARSTGTYRNKLGQNPEENTVADLFGKEGYVTATIGKHHMFMPENDNHGFDHVFQRGGPNTPLPPDESITPLRWWDLVGVNPVPNDQHTCGLIKNETIRFITENKDNPFVVWCSFPGPHTPITPSLPWAKQYDPEKLTLPPTTLLFDENLPDFKAVQDKAGIYDNLKNHRITLAYYYGLVSQIDYNIGLIIDKLKELDLYDNTIIVFTADHGELMSEFGAWTKGRSVYNATLKIPMIVRVPGERAIGSINDKMVCSIDLLPTLLDYSGLEIPANIQGLSLRPLMNGTAKGWRKYAFTEGGNNHIDATKVVTNETHKYIRFNDKDGEVAYEQFFDLVKDPLEAKNLIGDKNYSKVIGEFKDALAIWDQETEFSAPVPAPGEAEPESTIRNNRDRRQRERDLDDDDY